MPGGGAGVVTARLPARINPEAFHLGTILKAELSFRCGTGMNHHPDGFRLRAFQAGSVETHLGLAGKTGGGVQRRIALPQRFAGIGAYAGLPGDQLLLHDPDPGRIAASFSPAPAQFAPVALQIMHDRAEIAGLRIAEELVTDCRVERLPVGQRSRMERLADGCGGNPAVPVGI